MYILGVNISHDPSACLLKDGEMVYYSEDERLTGVKSIEGSFDEVLDEYYESDEIIPSFDQADAIKTYTNYIDYIIFTSFGRHDINDDHILIKSVIRKLNEKNVKYNTLLFYEDNHHIYHAANAFYASGFDDAAALVMDGGGAYDNQYRKDITSQKYKFPFREVESIFNCTYDFPSFNIKYKHCSMLDLIGDERNEEFIFWKRSPTEIYSRSRSCGDLFSLMAEILDMDESTGTAAGKVMGLAGHRLTSSVIRENFNILRNYERQKEIFVTDSYYSYEDEWITAPNLWPRIDEFARETNLDTSLKGPTFDFYLCASLAHKLQEETFNHTCRLIEKTVQLTRKNKIVLSGGYFMNCVNNYKYTRKFPDIEFFVDPMPHDAGTAIGAAKYLWYGLTKSREKYPFKDVYFGTNI